MGAIERGRTWCGRNLRIDDLLTVAALVLASLSVAASDGPLFSYQGLALHLWSVPLIAVFLARHCRPQTAALCFACCCIVQVFLGPSLIAPDLLALPMVVAAVAHGDPRNHKKFIALACVMGTLAAASMTWAYAVGPLVPRPFSAPCATLLDGQVHTACLATLADSFTRTLIPVQILIAAAVVVAFWQRARTDTIRILHERNAAIAAREREENTIAALAERARIARDMHDVVAHTLSIIIVQSDAGRYAGIRHPDIARHTMLTIRDQAHRASHDMTLILGALGQESCAGYGDIDALIAQTMGSGDGCRVERAVHGIPQPDRLAKAADTALYRLVQEALSNVRRHAGANVTVQIDESWTDHDLSVSIEDDGRGVKACSAGQRTGYGLLGMHERIEALGGSCHAGPGASGGFAVRATIPYASPPWHADAAIGHDGEPREITAHDASASPFLCGTGNSDDMRDAGTGKIAGDTVSTRETGDTGNTGGISSCASDIANARKARMSHMAGMAATDASGGMGPQSEEHAQQGMSHGTNRPDTTPSAGMAHSEESAAPSASHLSPALMRLTERVRRSATPLDLPASGDDARLNGVERLSRWAQRRVLLVDMAAMVALWVASITLAANGAPMLDPLLSFSSSAIMDGSGITLPIHALYLLAVLAPLGTRRRFPRASAIHTVAFAIVQISCVERIPFENVTALIILYSVALYGKGQAWRYALLAGLSGSALLGVRTALYLTGLHPFMRTSTGFGAYYEGAMGFLVVTTVLSALCVGTVAWARWSHTQGTNALILRDRQEALQAEQRRARVLAANRERERIGIAIRGEVTAALDSVIAQADIGMRMLDTHRRDGTVPPEASIDAAFKAIGHRGRSALARMRRLLTMLRQTGFSDGTLPRADDTMPLHPAADIGDRLRTASP